MLAQCVLALVVAAPGSSGAQADKLIAEGVELRQAGKTEEALPLFRKAHELSGSPRALAQWGLAEAALSRWLDAETHLTAALATQGDRWIDGNREAIERTLVTVTGKLGWLELAVKPPGARVRVNNQDLGRAPLARALRLTAGPANVEIESMGYQSVSRTLTVGAGGTTRVAIELKTQALASSGTKASDAARFSAPTAPLVPPPDPEAESTADKVPTLAWITGAVAVASTGVGVAGTVVQLGCGEDCDSSAGVVLMAVGYGLGAIMAGITVWQLIDAGVVGEEPPAIGWAPVIGPGQVGVSASW